jgi:integrase
LNAYQAARKHRIVSIKSFCRYLRDVEGKLEASNDASLSLRVPPPRPEKALRDKGYTIEAIEKLYQALGRVGKTPTMQAVQSVRDILCLHAKTGMHGTEVERLAKGEGKVTIQEGHGEIAATIKFIHKSGRVHVQSIDHQTLAAVQRLQARGVVPSIAHMRNVVFNACDAIGIERVTFGELRHSFVTWASERGEEVRSKSGGLPLSVIAVAVGHHSAATTKRFYDNVKVPPMIKIPIKLENPDDPPCEFSASAVSA